MPLTVEVTTDGFPFETSWELINTSTGQVEKTSPEYTAKNEFHRDEYCVPEAQYNFTIYDTAGDGICCSFGEGSYRVLFGLEVVAEGGEFTDSESTTFGVRIYCMRLGTMPLTVEVTTDGFPFETSWELINTSTGQVEKTSPIYINPATFHRDEYCVPEAQYEFTIYDTAGDGICCFYGEGSYSLKYGQDVVAEGGEFTDSESTTFGSVTASPKPTFEPTPKPTMRAKAHKSSKSKAKKTFAPSYSPASSKPTSSSKPTTKTSSSGSSKAAKLANSCEGEACDRKRVREHTDITSVSADPLSTNDKESG
ncbi:hypothetical protein ACHAXR_002518 [Thalassiosira sp. AJA248-18]